MGSEILDLVELHAFVSLAERLHFGRTADVLHITQPALSKQIRRLEEKVGGPLFERGTREVRLTPAGHALLARARIVLTDCSEALTKARQVLRGERGVLRIGFGCITIEKLLPELLRRLRMTHPGVTIQVLDMSTRDQLSALSARDLDAGFVRLPGGDSQIVTHPVIHDRLAAVTGPNGAWRQKRGLKSLSEQPFVTLSRTTSQTYYDHVIAVCRAAGFTPQIVQETNSLFTMMMLVRAGAGVALAPSSEAFRRIPGLRFREIDEPESSWDIGIAYLRERATEPLIRTLLEVVAHAMLPVACAKAAGTA